MNNLFGLHQDRYLKLTIYYWHVLVNSYRRGEKVQCVVKG